MKQRSEKQRLVIQNNIEKRMKEHFNKQEHMIKKNMEIAVSKGDMYVDTDILTDVGLATNYGGVQDIATYKTLFTNFMAKYEQNGYTTVAVDDGYGTEIVRIKWD